MPELETLLVMLLTLSGVMRFSNVTLTTATGVVDIDLAGVAAPTAPGPLDLLVTLLGLAAGARLTKVRIGATGLPGVTLTITPR